MPKKISFFMVAVLLCVSLTGCTKMISLTDDEAEEIAIYTSSLIAKYNKKQTNGLTYISEIKREEIEAEAASSYQTEEAEPEDTVDEEVVESEITDDTEATEDEEVVEGTASEIGGTDGTTHATATTEELSGETIGLTDLVDTSGISVSYQGATAANNYGSDGVFDISPTRGYQYLVMTFQLKNTSSSAVSVDMERLGLVFRATVNGVTARADQTILLEDFQTFSGKLDAGASQNVVLLFQYPADGLSDLSNLSLRVVRDGTTYTVVL